MLQITEDTPPDMLAGAMDLAVHLPTGRSVKMSVERSTPMMDLLVQITTNHHLQLSGYTLQVLGMAPAGDHNDCVLPYKPNTPIGALDTQHIKVIPKTRTMPVPKNVPPGHQPFESTFRLKVHLPRNQLYVTRVSQSVHLGDIMKKVCEEKNLDPQKYELRHPGNLDEILDPKFTLSDYQITEIYVVSRGTTNLHQVFSSSDIMNLRKEEERKQIHNKTGGGVFNLIFRRGKSSSGSLSSENRSISPTHSDDSRSVTPPGVSPPNEPLATERPKPPQRKRRPAPKPPQEANKPEAKKNDTGLTICHSRNSSDSSGYHEASTLSDNCNTSLPRRPKSALITDVNFDAQNQSSSNLSKMSGYSKSTSSLALPNRKKKAAPPPPPVLKVTNEITPEEPSPVVASQPPTVEITESHGKGPEHLVSNSTNPLPTPRSRTKNAPAPRPRSVIPLTLENISENSSDQKSYNHQENTEESTIQFGSPTLLSNQQPFVEAVKSVDDYNEIEDSLILTSPTSKKSDAEIIEALNSEMVNTDDTINDLISLNKDIHNSAQESVEKVSKTDDEEKSKENMPDIEVKANFSKLIDHTEKVLSEEDNLDKKLSGNLKIEITETLSKSQNENLDMETTDKVDNIQNKDLEIDLQKSKSKLFELQKQSFAEIFNSDTFGKEEKVKPPAVVAFLPKTIKKDTNSFFDSYSRKRGFQIGSSLIDLNFDDNPKLSKKNSNDSSTPSSVASALNTLDFVDEIDGLDVEMFTGSLSRNSKNINLIINQLHGMHELDSYKKNPSGGSLRSISSVPGFMGSNMRKWKNFEELDDISVHSFSGQNGWVIGDTSDSESLKSTADNVQATPHESLTSFQSFTTPSAIEENLPIVENVKSETSEDTVDYVKNLDEPPDVNPPPPPPDIIPPPDNPTENGLDPEEQKETELDLDWQYQLPSPPKAFRDSSPVVFTETKSESVIDSVVTSPELFEKLKEVKDNQSEKETCSDITSVMSEEDKPLFNTLSLENLEKRKSLVYNRVLATSLKMPEEDKKTENETFSSSLTTFEKTFDEISKSSPKENVSMKSTLPNFKITTYDNPKQKLKVFEDDTIYSNTDRVTNTNSLNNPVSPLRKDFIGRSMENIAPRKNSFENGHDTNYTFYKPVTNRGQFTVNRSESFKKEQTWMPTKPVTRSVSQVALNNKYKDNRKLLQTDEDSLTKSNSLFDVSGLQSLGVMRLIQNKLNTPNNSTEELDVSYQKPPEIKNEVQKQIIEEKPVPVKTFNNQYRVPSINMGTWSERPKIPVNVKEDPDYKFGVRDTTNSKLIVNTINNDIRSYNTIEIRNKSTAGINRTPSNIRLEEVNNKTLNNSETISGQNTGNVLIKIGTPPPLASKPVLRRPLGNINADSTHQQRPHSIAFGSDFDISRVPIVRSVEFKKPYKEFQNNNIVNNNNNNTSITQIYQQNNNFSRKVETSAVSKPQVEIKPVFRVNSFLQNSSAPIVRGFRNSSEANTPVWSQPHSFSTLPAKPYTTNKAVPFSQSNLRRTESTKVESNNIKNIENNNIKNLEHNRLKHIPPPAPAMPAPFKPVKKPQTNFGGADPKEQLLQAIRDFGGKKGLKAVKV